MRLMNGIQKMWKIPAFDMVAARNSLNKGFAPWASLPFFFYFHNQKLNLWLREVLRIKMTYFIVCHLLKKLHGIIVWRFFGSLSKG